MNTFTRLIVLIAVLSATTLGSYCQTFDWAKRAGQYAFDYGYGICADNAGNVYIAGKYEMNAMFSGITVGCAGNHDIFVAKYSPSGVCQWVRTAGGTWGDYAHAVTCDGEGNVYLTGEMETTTYFGTIALTSNGGNDVFVAKYNTNGDLQWAKKIGGGKDGDRGYGISCSGNAVYVTGYFESSATLAGKSFVSAGGDDIFIAKYTTGGTLVWIKAIGGSGNDQGKAIKQDGNENVFVTGYFSNTVDFGGTSLSSSGAQDLFVAKYDPSGKLIWVKKAGSTGDDYSLAMTIDNNEIYLTGGFSSSCSFENNILTSVGNADLFIARYTKDGNFVWAKKAGGSGADCSRAIAVDAYSNLYITGNYANRATFDFSDLTGVDASEIFFASYDKDGKFRWVLGATGEVDADDPGVPGEMGMCITTDKSGNIFSSGAFRSNSAFGNISLAKYNHSDIFITKIKQGSFIALITPMGSTSISAGGSVTLQANTGTGYSYLWKKNGTVITGATGSTYTATTEGNYTVAITKDNETAVSSPVTVRASLTFHFKKPSSWSTAKVHYWNVQPSGSYTNTSWPGMTMTADPALGAGWYTYSLPKASCTNLVFDDDGKTKTPDLNLCGEGWYDGNINQWVSKPEPGKPLIIHFRKQAGWSSAKLFYWNMEPSGAYPNIAWPGMNMNYDPAIGVGWYTVSLPAANCTNLVFDDGNGTKTSDLSLCGEGWYDGYTKQWIPKPGKDVPVKIHFKKPSAWPAAKVHYWYTLPSGSYPSTSWPGVNMADDPAMGAGWYTLSLPNAYCVNLVFNDGNGIKSADLSLCGEGWYDNGWKVNSSKIGDDDVNTNTIITGTAENDSQDGLLVFPNPAKDYISVNYNFEGEKDVALKVFDIMGKLKFSDNIRTANSYSIIINNKDWHNGIYLIAISDGINTMYKKVLINQ